VEIQSVVSHLRSPPSSVDLTNKKELVVEGFEFTEEEGSYALITHPPTGRVVKHYWPADHRKVRKVPKLDVDFRIYGDENFPRYRSEKGSWEKAPADFVFPFVIQQINLNEEKNGDYYVLYQRA